MQWVSWNEQFVVENGLHAPQQIKHTRRNWQAPKFTSMDRARIHNSYYVHFGACQSWRPCSIHIFKTTFFVSPLWELAAKSQPPLGTCRKKSTCVVLLLSRVCKCVWVPVCVSFPRLIVKITLSACCVVFAYIADRRQLSWNWPTRVTPVTCTCDGVATIAGAHAERDEQPVHILHGLQQNHHSKPHRYGTRPFKPTEQVNLV